MKYDLVFEGGGAKGMVLVGAYDTFVQRGHTHGRLLGTSAGAITAALIAAGYTPHEMLDALNEREDNVPVFAKFMGEPASFSSEEIREGAIRQLLRDIDVTLIPNFLEEKIDDHIANALARHSRGCHVVSLVQRGGWYAATRFVTWLQEKLDIGTWAGGPRQFSGMTLAQFYAATQVDVSFVASDTSSAQLLVLNHHTAPQCPLVWAVRMSMSIPLLWDEVLWHKEWGAYRGTDITGNAIVDGGMLSNFPIELFISDAPHITALMGPKQENPVLGLLIDETQDVPQPRGLLVRSDVDVDELVMVKRIRRLVDTAISARDKMVIDEFAHLVVRLPAGGYGTTEFDMSDARRNALVNAGRTAMAAYLAQPSAPATRDIGSQTRARARADRIASNILGR